MRPMMPYKKALAEAKKQAERYAQEEAVKDIPNLKCLALVYQISA